VQSIHANHELLVISESPGCYHAFRRRWDEMLGEGEKAGDKPVFSPHNIVEPSS
jgi:hypothetical protein